MILKPETLKAGLKTLKAARELIETSWFQGYFARRADGSQCSALASAATCFCTLGAVQRVTFGPASRLSSLDKAYGEKGAYTALRVSIPDWANGSIPSWNDSPNTTLPDVLKVFDKAIQWTNEEIRKAESHA